MQSSFSNRQIVWAKVKGYPWWPAEIAKLPTPDHNVFKVIFIAQDTHAFLNPRDVRKYAQFYDQCSKKKMRGLGPAIQTADEFYKKRIENMPKNRSPCNKPRANPKIKGIKKINRRSRAVKDSEAEDELDQIEQEQVYNNVPKSPQEESNQNENAEREQEAASSDQGSSDGQCSLGEKFMNESEEKVDRAKIEAVEREFFICIQEIRQGQFQIESKCKQLQSSTELSDEELVHSKITNMLAYIVHHLKHQREEDIDRQDLKRRREDLVKLTNLQHLLSMRIKNYLNDTSYYDQFLRLIQKNKRNRSEYESRLIAYLRTSYKIKKELAAIFAARLVGQINNGTILREKQLLEDIKQHRAQITSISNKTSIDRCIEHMINKYV